MSYNIYLWGFDDSYTRDVIRELEDENLIIVKRWFVSGSMVGDEFFEGRSYIEPPWRFDVRKDYENESLYTPKKIDDYFYKNMMMILHNFNRSTDCFSIPMHEVLNMIHCLKNHYYYLLDKDKPELIIFYNLPHYPEGIILYFLAKAMGVKTLLFTMTSFIGETSYVFSLDDYGKCENVPEYEPLYTTRHLENIEISHTIDMPYTTKTAIKHDMGLDKPWYRKLRAFLHPLDYCCERWNLIVDGFFEKYEGGLDFIEMRSHKLVNKLIEERMYSDRFDLYCKEKVDFQCDYVYFPLHLQPEMSTDTNGGMFTDQLLALEKLARVMPRGWKIYVKENPKQKAYKRGKYFFRRLNLIPNVVLLSRQVDTIKLMKNSKCVVTINGTAAWEAVRGGRPAIIFGKYWYEGLPGIFKFSDDIDLEKVCQYQIDRQYFNECVYKKKKKMLPVVLYDSDIQYVKGFNQNKNKEELARFFYYILPLVR